MLPISSTLRAGIRALTRLQSNALAPSGITVNSVLPGHTLTDRQRHLASIQAENEGGNLEEVLKRRGEMIPIGRMATADEIGAAVAFLCSRQAASITGESLVVDGGMTRGI